MHEEKNHALHDLLQPQHPLQPQKKQVDISLVEPPVAAAFLSRQQPMPEPRSTPGAKSRTLSQRVIPGKKHQTLVASAYFWQDCAAQRARAISAPCSDGGCYALNPRLDCDAPGQARRPTRRNQRVRGAGKRARLWQGPQFIQTPYAMPNPRKHDAAPACKAGCKASYMIALPL